MDSEERPNKMRKLENNEVEKSSAQVSSLSEDNASLAAASAPTEAVSSNQETEQSSLKDNETTLPNPSSVAPMLDSTPSTTTDPPLSKSQQKKLKRRAEWDAKREDRKIWRKEKQTAKRERARAAKAAQQQQQATTTTTPPPARPQPPRAVQLPITILVDCDFDELMHEGERTSLGSQITRCYSDNKNSTFRAHLAICSFGGKLRQRFDTVLEKNYASWKGVRTFDEGFVEVAEKAKEWMCGEQGGKLAGSFSKFAEGSEEEREALKAQGEVIYLSSEATEDLTELRPYSTYIIGGLVDKNREKGICHRRATKAGVKTARLPIGEFMEMQSRKVLATNHVNEIMMKWLECGDWGEAFVKVIPKRKGGKLKGEGGGEGGKKGGADGSKNDGDAAEDAHEGEADREDAVTGEDAAADANEEGENGEPADDKMIIDGESNAEKQSETETKNPDLPTQTMEQVAEDTEQGQGETIHS